MNERRPWLRRFSALFAGLAAVSQIRTAEAEAPSQPANPAGPPTEALSERTAVAELVQKNPSLHAALLSVAQAEYDVRAEDALYVPVFTANAGYTRSRQPVPFGNSGVTHSTSDTFDLGAGITKTFPVGTRLSLELSGQRHSSPDSGDAGTGTGTGTDTDANANGSGASLGPTYSVLGRLSLVQPLLRGSGTRVGLASLRAARFRHTAALLRARDSASQALRDALTAYWELWYADAAVQINQASRDLAGEQARQAREQVATGAMATADSLIYSTRLAELEEAVASAETQRKARAIALGLALGEPERGPNLSAGDSPREMPEPLESQTAWKLALENSPELKALAAELALSRDQLRIAGDPLRPRLDLDAYVQTQGLGNREVPPAFDQLGRMQAVSAHVGLTFETPLTDSRRTAQIASSQLSAHILEKQIEAARQRLQSDLLTARSSFDNHQKLLQLASETERIAEQQAQAERQRFAAGASIAIQVQQAEDTLRQAELRVQRARVDLIQSALTLQHLTAELLPHYADVLRQLPQSAPRIPEEASGPL